MDLLTVGTRQAKRYLEQSLKAGLVPFVQSSPGCGKSQIVAQIAEEQGLVMIDHRLSTSDITDLNGLPRFIQGKDREIATFVPFDLFPIEGTPLPKGKNGWLLFLDEFNSASEEVQAAAYKLVLDRAVGQHKLDPRVKIVCAGNLDTDKAITRDLSTAMTSRLVKIKMEPVFDEWMTDVALTRNFDPMLLAYMQMNQSDLLNFQPEKMEADASFSCPRTIEFLDKMLKSGMEINDSNVPLISGIVGQGMAIKLNQFVKVKKSLITFEAIIKDPKGCPVPTENSVKWVTLTTAMQRVDADNFELLDDYIQRFNDISFTVLFYRSVTKNHQEIVKTKAFVKRVASVAKYIFD